MGQLFLKIYIILILNMVILKNAQSEIFIVAEVNEEIITNLDIDFEKRTLAISHWFWGFSNR